MSIARLSRERKRQLGQFLTPRATAAAIVRSLPLRPDMRILEPSFGAGAFLLEIAAAMSTQVPADRFSRWATDHLFGCELDDSAYSAFRREWKDHGFGPAPASLEHGDFLTWMPHGCDRQAATDRRRYFASRLEFFDLVIGNPPFGGSINPALQDELDAIFGIRDGRKIKKETYAFFLVKGVDLLKPGGKLVFICSDTLMTIPTMTGLRAWLQSRCAVDIAEVPGEFAETNQDMVLVTLTKQHERPESVTVFGRAIPIERIEATPNMSWRIDADLARYFTGVSLGDKMIASSGMTIGNNDLFLRRIVDGQIVEPYEFRFVERPITLDGEVARARLGKVGAERLRDVRELEARGETETVVAWETIPPRTVRLPHRDYRFYNKASSKLVYAEPEWVVFWRDDGKYVYTFKKTGNWYLRGVGGKPFFGREGLTWSLIAPRLYARYLPPGYILDSGAPCAFLRPGVDADELFFVLGWTLTDLCNRILKTVLNHTRNIQSKDFERLPYPSWVPPASRATAIEAVKRLLAVARDGTELTGKSPQVRALNELYNWPARSNSGRRRPHRKRSLF
jgi:hypothetical protein